MKRLRDYVEGADGQPQLKADDFEVLRLSPTLGDSKYKLEIAIGGPAENSTKPFLSLFITSLEMDYAHGGFESSATMLAAVKSQDEAVGARGVRPEWVWDFWQHDWVFRHEREVWGKSYPFS